MDGKSQQAAVNEPMIQPNLSTDQPQSKEQVTVGEQNLSSDYTDATLETWNKIPLHLRIHVLVAYVTCTILFFVWHWSGSPVWWWIFPFFFFAAAIACHYFFYQYEWQKGIAALVIIGNICAFVSWGLMTPNARWSEWWFIFIVFPTAIAYTIFHYWRNKPDRWWECGAHVYWMANLMLFLTWLTFGQGFPWFIFPLFGCALFPLLWILYFVHHEKRLWIYATVVCFDINLLLFLTWGFTDSVFPWWIFPVAASVGICVWLYIREKRNRASFEKINVPEDINKGSSNISSESISKSDEETATSNRGMQPEDAIPV